MAISAGKITKDHWIRGVYDSWTLPLKDLTIEAYGFQTAMAIPTGSQTWQSDILTLA